MKSLIVPGIGCVALRADGSVAFVNRDRVRHEIPAEVVKAIVQLAALGTAAESDRIDYRDPWGAA